MHVHMSRHKTVHHRQFAGTTTHNCLHDDAELRKGPLGLSASCSRAVSMASVTIAPRGQAAARRAAGLLPQATRECERHGGGRRAPLSIQYSRLKVPATIAMGIEDTCRAHSNSRATASRAFARCSPTAAHDHRQVYRWARPFNAPMACSAPAKRVDPRSNALKDVGATRLELGGVCRITRCVV